MIKNKKGFSLIEMGVVVAIVALIFLVSLNAVQSMYTAYVNKSAKAALTIGKQEVLNFAAQYKRLPTSAEFDSSIRGNIPMNQDSQPLTYQTKSTIADFLTPEQYCVFTYMPLNEATPLGTPLENLPIKPFSFAIEYQYKKENPITEIVSYFELLDVLGCADKIKPSFITAQLPPIINGSPYETNIIVKAKHGDGAQFCLELTSIPAGTVVSDKFQTNAVLGTCNDYYCVRDAGECGNDGNYGDADNESIVLTQVSDLGSADGVRIKAFIKNKSDSTYHVEKEYIIYRR
jgi:prepilin-type N-terminal cleavage/methylation domain-containing protein